MGATSRNVKTPYGNVIVLIEGNVHFIQRHGRGNVPPHMINHRANLMALKKLRVKKVIGINSAGSLKKSIKPLSIMVPDDYIQFGKWDTYFDNRRVHVTPGINEGLRKLIIKASKKAGIKVIERGVYIQMPGPRLETKAEIRMIRNFGDVTAMTMASEATLSKELGLAYASICSVDNYAHGMTKAELSAENIFSSQKKNIEKIKRILAEVIKELG